MVRMHDDELEIDERLVRRLLAAQFPQWAERPLERVESTGTVNAIFRLGSDLSVRLPRTPRWHDLDSEVCGLGALAGRLPIPIPHVVARGEPAEGFAWPWAVFRWIDGSPWTSDGVVDPCRAAAELAGFLRELQRLDPDQAGCGTPRSAASLAASDSSVREAAAAARGMLDVDALLGAWEEALRLPAWDGQPLLLHGDVLAGNVLIRDGRIGAIIDWADVRAGDPARDLMAAWTLFSGDARARFRAEMGFDEHTWARARGWVLTRITNVAYYAVTNPSFSADARTTIAEALRDPG